MVEKRIMLKLGELVTVESVPNGVFVSVRGVHQATADSEADCFDTLAARFRTLAVELEHMATAHRPRCTCSSYITDPRDLAVLCGHVPGCVMHEAR